MMSNLKEPAKLGKKGIFGSQADRFSGFAMYDGKRFPLRPPVTISPGPGEHQDLSRRDGFHDLKGTHTVAVFKSKQHRLPRDITIDRSQKPDPGAYEAFDKVNYRNKFRRAK